MVIDQAYLGDCMTGLREMYESNIRANLILTDPPYGQKWRLPTSTPNSYSNGLRKIDGDEDTSVFKNAAPLLYDALAEDGTLLCFCSAQPDLYYDFYSIICHAGFRYVNTIVWDKQIATLGAESYYRPQYEYIIYATKLCKGFPYFNTATRFQQGNVILYPRINLNISGTTDDTRRIHPNQKPVPMLRRLIATHCPPRGLVLDPFAGSNSTAIAAYQEGRHYITFEKQQEYYDAGIKILNQVKSQTTLFDSIEEDLIWQQY